MPTFWEYFNREVYPFLRFEKDPENIHTDKTVALDACESQYGPDHATYLKLQSLYSES